MSDLPLYQRFFGQATLQGLCLLPLLASWSWGEDASESSEGLDPSYLPPVYAFDDFTRIDDRLWTAAVSRRPELIRSAPAAVFVLTGDDLRLSPAFNWADRLRYEAGVDVYQSRHGQYDVGLRGYNGITNQRLIINVDGREFGRSVTGEQYGHWSGFLFLSDIERVEVVKGPSSVAYGANAFGGIISLSGRSVGQESQAFVHSHVGGYGKREVDGTLLVPLAEYFAQRLALDLKVNAGYTEAGPRPSTPGPPVLMDHPRLGNTGAIDLRSNRQRLILGSNFFEDVRIELEYLGLEMRDQALTGLYTAVTAQGQFQQHGVGLTLRGDWGRISHWEQGSRATWESEYVLYDPSRDYYYNQAGFRDRRRVSEADFFFDLGDHRLTLGASWIDWSSRSNIWDRNASYLNPDSWVKIRNRSWGVFAQDQWSITPSWTLTAGLRYDKDEQVGSNWSPRVALNWILDAEQFFRLSYSRGYRIPSLIEGNMAVYYFEADENLAAEHIQAVEIGYERHFADQAGHVILGASYSRANQLISLEPYPTPVMEDYWRRWLRVEPYGGATANPLVTQTPGPFFAYTNLDNPMTIIGAEASASWRWQEVFSGSLEVKGNATWQRLRYRDPIIYWSPGFEDPWLSGERIFAFYGDLGRKVNAPPPWKLNAGLNWDDGHWNLGLLGRFVASRSTFSVGNTYWASRSDLAVQKTASYAALDAHLAWRNDYRLGTIWLRAGIMDVFNTAHYEAYERDVFDQWFDLAKGWTSEVGRSWHFALDWHW